MLQDEVTVSLTTYISHTWCVPSLVPPPIPRELRLRLLFDTETGTDPHQGRHPTERGILISPVKEGCPAWALEVDSEAPGAWRAVEWTYSEMGRAR